MCAYVLPPEVHGVLEPSVVFEAVKGDEVLDHAVTSDLGRLVYTTGDAVVSVVEGAEAWRVAFEPGADHVFHHRPGCVLSSDGREVWVFRPDAMAGRGTADHWLVLDALTGSVRAVAELGTSGHGADQFVSPVDGRVLLSVGEGQDGCPTFLGSLSGDRLDLSPFPWSDRVVVALSPDGGCFLSVDHAGQDDVAVHAYPSGDVLFRLTVADFGLDPEEFFAEFVGGFLTAETAVVAFLGETDSGEHFTFRRVSLPDGLPGPELVTSAVSPESVSFLGDSTYVTSSSSAHPVRVRV